MVVKTLPPVIKQLLTLRSPGLPPMPPVSKLSAVLRSTFDDARNKKAETGWLTLAVSTTEANLMASLAPTDPYPSWYLFVASFHRHAHC
jgi:hypothetical protein